MDESRSRDSACRRQSKRSERALAESGGVLKYTELLHIKTDLQAYLVRLPVCAILAILYSCLKKGDL